jgi:hypothetical protein
MEEEVDLSDENYFRHIKYDFFEDEPIPADEFVEHFNKHMLKNARRNISRDGYSIISGIQSLFQHLTYAEFVGITLASLGMTLFFCYYYYPGPEEEYRLAARLRFNIIVTAVLFPSTMLANETASRRESALRRFAFAKASMCQLLRAYLTWRAPNVVMTKEWEAHAYRVMLELDVAMHLLLTLPTIRDRHETFERGKLFAKGVENERIALHERLIRINFNMHVLVEDLKDAGLSPQEAIRFFQYIQLLSKELEGMWAIKVYRTGRTARAFVRVILTACIFFYG